MCTLRNRDSAEIGDASLGHEDDAGAAFLTGRGVPGRLPVNIAATESAASPPAVSDTAWPALVSFGEALTDLIRIDSAHWRAAVGGSCWNVARAAACLGVRSAFAGCISEDCFGDELAAASAAAGLDLRFLQRVAAPPLLAVVPQQEPPQYFFIGTATADLAFDAAALPEGYEQAVRWAHFGGISLARPPLAERLLQLAESLQGRGVRISYDPNYRKPLHQGYARTYARFCALADLVKISDEDLCGLSSRPADEALAELRAIRGMRPLLVTRGAAGASLYVAGRVWEATAPSINLVDSVGAGDASLAGFLCSDLRYASGAPAQGEAVTEATAGRAHGAAPVARDCAPPWAQHLAQAVAAGSAACLQAGARPPSPADVAALLPAVRVVERSAT